MNVTFNILLLSMLYWLPFVFFFHYCHSSDGKVYVFERVPKDQFEKLSYENDVCKSVDTPENGTDCDDVANDFKESMYVFILC